MGSFNTHCFATQQIIAPGDACFVFPIIQQSTYDSLSVKVGEADVTREYGIGNETCYPASFWDMYGNMLEAEYADYGRFEIKDTPVNRIRLGNFIVRLLDEQCKVFDGDEDNPVEVDLEAFVKESASSVVQFYLNPTKKPVSKKKLFVDMCTVFSHIQEKASSRKMFALGMNGNVRPLDFAVVHKVSFDLLTEEVACFKSNRRSYNWMDVANEALAVLAKPSDSPKPTTKAKITEARRASHEISFKLSRILCASGNFEELSYPGEGEELIEQIDVFTEGKSHTAEALLSLVKPLLQTRYFMIGLESYGLKISPMVYGSQDYENETGRRFAKLVASASEIICANREDADDNE